MKYEVVVLFDSADAVREFQVRMKCGHFARRMMRPSTASRCERNESGELFTNGANCPDCGGPKPY